MTNGSNDWTVHEVRRHAIAAVIACAISLFAHVALLIWMPEIVIRPPAGAPPREKKWPAFRLADIERLQAGPARPMKGDQPLQTAGTVPGVVELRRPPDPARIQPLPVTGISGMSDARPPAAEKEPPRPNFWQPRQELLSVQNRVVPDDKALMPRRLLPPVERVPRAEDVVSPFDRKAIASMAKGDSMDLSVTAPRAGVGLDAVPVRGGRTNVQAAGAGTGAPDTRALVGEEPAAITGAKPIDDFLSVDVAVFRPLLDRGHTYFRLDIRRRSSSVLPVMPRNLLLVVDSSASMTEQKLFFCREGLQKCLDAVRPPDKFNVMAFNDSARYCFDSWAEPDAAHIVDARRFVQGLKAEGNTDVFASIRDLPEKTATDSARPVVVILVTDGRPTVGLMDSSNIIGEFSRLNNGRISVFTFGTAQTANSYLLDLLGYCNRGEGFVLRSGRWDIPGAMVDWVNQTARPVLGDVRFVLPADSPCEMFPVHTANMYLDRDLVLYGRCPRSMERVLFQATGRSRENLCDMVCQVSLAKPGSVGGDDIRQAWARQKIYHLIGLYARTADPTILRRIQETAREYDVEIPHRGRF